MVLQRGVEVPVWGSATPGEMVTVEFGETKRTATADTRGKWALKLRPLRASAEPRVMTIQGSQGERRLEITNVLVGEVWLCSGQSNMGVPVRDALNGAEESKLAHFPQIRMITIRTTIAKEPLDRPQCDPPEWRAALPENVSYFSAVGYFLGRELHESLKVPIGLIHSSWGGSVAEAWTSRETLMSEPEFASYLRSCETNGPDYGLAQNAPAVLYNGMVRPLAPYAIRGVVWYQGEGNARRAWGYRKLLPAMIADWRALWPDLKLPFGIVSLANFMAPPQTPGESTWAELREAQALIGSLPGNGLAVAIDIGDRKDIHPKNKQEVGRRLSLWARSRVYNQAVEYSGPVYKKMKIENNRIRLRFDHLAGGLVAEGGPLKSFAIAGEDKLFHWAEAWIEGKTVVVSAREVAKPVAVRYAWSDNPEGCNLYNKAGLPAVPFRTDKWLASTMNAR